MLWIALVVEIALAQDQCPTDPAKVAPGLCGCGVADSDWNGDLAPDSCIDPAATVHASVVVGRSARVDAGGTVASGASLGALSHVGAGASVGANGIVGVRAVLGTNASLGADSSIGRRSVLGAGSSSGSSAFIAADVEIGDDLVVDAPGGLVVGFGSRIGDRVHLGPNARLGNLSDLGDDVVAGADVSVGRGATVGADAVLQDRVGLGPAVAIGARAQLADDTLVRSGAVVGDDVTVGERAIIGRDAVVGHHSTIQDDAVLRSGVTTDPYALALADTTYARGAHLPTANQPPSAPGVTVTPARPYPTDDLTCAVTTPSVDPQGSAVTYAYTWLKDGAATGVSGALLSNSHTGEGERWTCVVTPSDGALTGATGQADEYVAQRFVFDPLAADQSFTVPAWSTEIVAALWGGAGGGGNAENGTHRGGAGGYVGGRLAVTGGQTFTVKVGQGGRLQHDLRDPGVAERRAKLLSRRILHWGWWRSQRHRARRGRVLRRRGRWWRRWDRVELRLEQPERWRRRRDRGRCGGRLPEQQRRVRWRRRHADRGRRGRHQLSRLDQRGRWAQPGRQRRHVHRRRVRQRERWGWRR